MALRRNQDLKAREALFVSSLTGAMTRIVDSARPESVQSGTARIRPYPEQVDESGIPLNAEYVVKATRAAFNKWSYPLGYNEVQPKFRLESDYWNKTSKPVWSSNRGHTLWVGRDGMGHVLPDLKSLPFSSVERAVFQTEIESSALLCGGIKYDWACLIWIGSSSAGEIVVMAYSADTTTNVSGGTVTLVPSRLVYTFQPSNGASDRERLIELVGLSERHHVNDQQRAEFISEGKPIVLVAPVALLPDGRPYTMTIGEPPKLLD